MAFAKARFLKRDFPVHGTQTATNKELSAGLAEITETTDITKTSGRAFFKGGDLNPGERHSRDTRDDGTVTLCTPRAAIVAQILVVF